ncbi:Cytochrome P450 4CG1, partial [Operophtera brumata]
VKWQHRRKLLTPAFHFNILKKFCRTFSEQTEEFVGQLNAEAASDKTDLMPLVSKHTLRVMCVTNKYFQGLFVIGKCIIYRVTRTWLYIDFMFNLTKAAFIQKIAVKDLHKFTIQIIKERREYVQMNQIENWSVDDEVYGKKSRLAMLDLLLDQEKKGRIDEEGIREEVDTFMFEGHDTTATALCFMMMRIANETTAQLAYIFGDSDRTPTMDDLADMKYLECCIKESLRLYPSVPFIARHITEDVILSGYKVPADTVCNIHIYDVHRRADLFPDPDKFIPERFLPENTAKRHPYAYIPFSAGPRNCIGQKFAILEMKTIMSGLLRKYRLEPVTKHEDIVFMCDIILRTKDPVYVRFRKRNK